jgi:ABC-type spermidine/putrescine transport system permease subunit I
MGICSTLSPLLMPTNASQATRWDNYLHIFDPKIHWFSLINSLLIAAFLCVMVSMILYRSVARDVSWILTTKSCGRRSLNFCRSRDIMLWILVFVFIFFLLVTLSYYCCRKMSKRTLDGSSFTEKSSGNLVSLWSSPSLLETELS